MNPVNNNSSPRAFSETTHSALEDSILPGESSSVDTFTDMVSPKSEDVTADNRESRDSANDGSHNVKLFVMSWPLDAITRKTQELGLQVTFGSYSDCYRNEGLLGKGAMGHVYRARSIQSCLSNDVVAVKILKCKELQEAVEACKNEVMASTVLEGLAPRVHALFCNRVGDRGSLCIIQEFIPGHSLSSYLSKQPNHRILEEHAREIFEKLAIAVHSIQQKRAGHCDLKPDNILMTDNEIKVIDWGNCVIDEDDHSVHQFFKGTIPYMAPDFVLSIMGTGFHIKKVDDWSLGVILYQMLTGQLPFMNEDYEMCNISSCSYMSCIALNGMTPTYAGFKWTQVHEQSLREAHISSAAIDLVRKMLTINPQERLGALDSLRHPWFLLKEG